MGLNPPTIYIDSSLQDVEMWAVNARLNASASNMEVLKEKDQKGILYTILERDLFLSLQLGERDGFMAGVEGVFDGLCNLFMSRVEFMKKALCRRLA